MKWLLCVIPFIVMYLCGSFCAISFDISRWSEVNRFLCSFLGLFFSVWITAFVAFHHNS